MIPFLLSTLYIAWSLATPGRSILLASCIISSSRLAFFTVGVYSVDEEVLEDSLVPVVPYPIIGSSFLACVVFSNKSLLDSGDTLSLR